MGVYDAALAPARARDNARRQRAGALVVDPELRELVKGKLEDMWSPQQISAWLRSEYPGSTGLAYLPGNDLSGGVSRPQRRVEQGVDSQAAYRSATAKRRRKATERTPRYVAPAVLIHRRPPIVETRTRIGDWEGDLIVGKRCRLAIGTLVDRTSRAVRLIHLPWGHGAEAFTDAFGDVLAVVALHEAHADVGPGIGDGTSRCSH